MKEKAQDFKFKDLFTDKLWTLETSPLSKARKRFVRFIKLVRITWNTFQANHIGFQCVALSYFVTLAIIPMLAFLFAISGGLGLSQTVTFFLHHVLPSSVTFADLLVEKANNIIDVAQSGKVGVVSAVVLLWTILWLMFQTERVFNNVWGIRKIPRNILARFGFYIGLMFLLPFIIIIFSYGLVFATNASKLIGLDTSEWRVIWRVMGWLVFYVITVFTLSAMFKFIPAAKVRYKNALKAAIFDAAVFVVFQYLYLETQTFVGGINTVYGVLAAIPLFLIWLNVSWQIIMYGAELTYGYQNLDTYHIPEWESDK